MNEVIKLPFPIDIPAQLRAIEKRQCELSLVEFIKAAWHVVEPGKPYIHNWHMDMIAEHLTAITDETIIDDDYYNRLLINVPPGAMKSLTCNVFWPAWEWGPRAMPWLRYVCAGHALPLALRDSIKMRRLVTSQWYQSHWGSVVQLTRDQNQTTKFETTKTGFRQACAFTGLTGVRADRVIIDDPHSVDSAQSDAERTSDVNTFLEAVPLRLDDPEKSAIIVIMQRLHEGDVSGTILDQQLGYDHIMLPMRYEPARSYPTKLGYEDPRETEGELFFEARFPLHVVERDEKVLGPYAVAGQFQQTPVPRGGGIVKPEWWTLWDQKTYPPVEYVVMSLDTAYTEKAENDPSALTVWGTFGGGVDGGTTRFVDRYGRMSEITQSFQSSELGPVPKVMLMYAWSGRLDLHELVQKVNQIGRKMKVDKILIENKAAGHSVAQELRRLFAGENYYVQMYDPKTLDKQARLYSVQHIFAEGMVYAPDKDWAEMVIRQVASFPKAKHDDLTDTVSMAIKHLRDIGLLTRSIERLRDVEDQKLYRGPSPPPLYAV
jgi:predicted phage terminase large subunit-like protein